MLSDFMIPLMFVLIIGYGLLKDVKVYDTFIIGAEEGFKIVLKIMPTLIGLMVAVGILRASGFLDVLTDVLTPISKLVHFPSELIPVALMRTVSSSASTGLILDLFKTYGRFINWTYDIHYDGLYRDGVLHLIGVFYDGKNKKYPLFPNWSPIS